MKYSIKNPPLQCMFTQSDWYREMSKYKSKPVGILFHDTDAGNPYLKRYVQPSENDVNRNSLLRKIGVNHYGNHWNMAVGVGVNAFIGLLENDTVSTVQVSPFEMHPWGCGNGQKGSCNGYIGNCIWQDTHWIQFEICDDGYRKGTSNSEYFNKIYTEAIEFTAYICKLYGIDPNGTAKFNGVTVPTILCHGDAGDLGLGSDHVDVRPWFGKYGKTMKDVRKDISKLIKESEIEVFKKGETSLGIKAIKSSLNAGKLLGIYSSGMEKNGGYGEGVSINVKQAQKEAGLTQKEEIDDKTITAIWTQLERAIKVKISELKAAKDTISKKDKEIESLNKKLDAANTKLDEIISKNSDVNGDGSVNTKDLLALRKKLTI